MKQKVFLGFALLTITLFSSDFGIDLLFPGGGLISQNLLVKVSANLAATGLLAVIFARLITRHIKQLAASAGVVSRGDLTHVVRVSSTDEVGELSRSFNTMVASLTNMVRQVQDISTEVNESAQHLSSTSRELNASIENISTSAHNISLGAGQQAQMSARVLGVARELAASVKLVNSQANQTAETAERAGQGAATVRAYALEVNQAFDSVAERLALASELVRGFSARAVDITKAVGRIAGIAQQTHLLAVNASIEAARAGEHGRGFAVVANEIRQLADNVGEFAESIGVLAGEIDSSSRSVLDSMEASTSTTDEGRTSVARAGSEIHGVLTSFTTVSDLVRKIAAASEQQSGRTSEVLKSVEEIASVARTNASATEEASTATEEQTIAMEELAANALQLAQASARLRELASVFVIEDSADNPLMDMVPPAGARLEPRRESMGVLAHLEAACETSPGER